MLKLFLALSLATTMSSSAMARSARSRGDQRASLVQLLSAYELTLQRPALDTIGRDIPELLMDIANTPRERPQVRVRAVAAMALYPSTEIQAFLRAQLWERTWVGSSLGVQMRNQAMRSLGRGFGERAVQDIASLKDDTDPLVREGVAIALLDTQSDLAVPVLEAWLPQESSFTVRDKIDRVLQKLKGM